MTQQGSAAFLQDPQIVYILTNTHELLLLRKAEVLPRLSIQLDWGGMTQAMSSLLLCHCFACSPALIPRYSVPLSKAWSCMSFAPGRPLLGNIYIPEQSFKHP